jgi:hypothetical protein
MIISYFPLLHTPSLQAHKADIKTVTVLLLSLFWTYPSSAERFLKTLEKLPCIEGQIFLQ